MGSGLTFGRGSAWKGASMVTEALKAFFAPPSSADRDLSLDLETLRLRSRQLFQNNTFSRALIGSFGTNVVGTGIKARPTLKQLEILGLTPEEAEAWQKKTQDLYELWANSKNCDAEKKNDFAQLQGLAFLTGAIGGDCFAVCKYDVKNRPFGLSIKLFEGDRVQNPFAVIDTEECAQGVEIDANGAAVAYHFTKKPAFGIDDYTNAIETVRVPAFDSFGNPNVIHIFTADRTDQRRGVPLLAPVISQLKQQERYQDAELMAAVVSACFTAVIENNSPDEAEDNFGNVPDEQRVEKIDANGNAQGSTTPAAMEMAPGAVWELAQGQKVAQVNPLRPNTNYQPFVESIFSEAAAAVGISHEVALRKFNSSYNAVRAAILESRKTFERYRQNFVADFCRPIYEKWLAQAVLTGVIEAPGFFDDPVKRALWCGCRWIADAAFLLDPLKETQAIKQQLDEQLIDRDTACAMINGGEYERVANKLAEEKRLRGEIGLQEPGTINKTESFSVSTDDPEQSDL